MSSYQLVIFDFYDTVVHMEDEIWLPRNGIPELLRSLGEAGKSMAICSDAGEENIRQRLGDLLCYFRGIYGSSTCFIEEGALYKNLERVCEDSDIPKEKAVFIGDNHRGTDERSAQRYGIEYIRVPHGDEEHGYDFLALAARLLS